MSSTDDTEKTDSQQLVLGGTHGTCVSRAQKIFNEGFIISCGKKGRIGSGIYFWRKGIYARPLAIAWWYYRTSCNDYDRAEKQECAVIHVSLFLNENEYLNADDFSFNEMLAEFAIRKKLLLDEEGTSGLYDYVIGLVEEKLKTMFKVIEVRVTTPPRKFCKFYPLKLIGTPNCYMVREPSCINILNIEENAKW